MSFAAIHVLSRAVFIEQGNILLCKTADLTPPFYFLPGGHVEHKESSETAVLRELFEEAGTYFKVDRFLGCYENSFEPGHNSICHDHEYNFIFKVNPLNHIDPLQIHSKEPHIELVWKQLTALEDIDFRPEGLRPYLNQWVKANHNPAFQSSMKISKQIGNPLVK